MQQNCGFGACFGVIFFVVVAVKMDRKNILVAKHMYKHVLPWKSLEFQDCGRAVPVPGVWIPALPRAPGKGHCHVGMMLDPAGKFPISHHRVTEQQWPLSPPLLVQLHLCLLILLQVLFPAHFL